MPTRLAIVANHPIQYFVPWYRELVKLPELEVKVFYCCDWGLNEYVDPQFGVAVKWDIPLLEGYDYEFLPLARRPERLGFWEVDNPAAGAALAHFNPDVVKVYGYARRTNWRVARWVRRNRKLLLMLTDSNVIAQPVWWKKAAKELVVRHFYRYLDGALAISDNNFAYHRYFGLPPERLFRARMPLDRERLLAQVPDVQAVRAEVRARHGIPPEAFVAILCGKYVAHKRPLDLVAAGHAAAQKGLPIWTLLVGEGAERPALEEFIRTHDVKNCTLTGFVNQSQISGYYAASDVLALPSSIEAYSLVAGEAAVFGLPIIVSDQVGCIGPQDTAQPGVNAIVFPCGAREELTADLLELCQNRPRYEKMAHASATIAATQDLAAAGRALGQAVSTLHQLGPRR